MTEADNLQRINEPSIFYQKLEELNRHWDVYKMAARIREVS